MDSFLEEWRDSLQIVHDGLNLLSGYPYDQLGGFHPGPQLSFEGRIIRQKEWINNLQGMEEHDQQFFQKHWVPVQEDLAQWFIDLSNPQFPVFAPYFLDLEPKGWFINPIMNSLAEFIIAVDNGITGHDLFQIESKGQLQIYSRENDSRNAQIFKSNVHLPTLKMDEVFIGRNGHVFQSPAHKVDQSSQRLPKP